MAQAAQEGAANLNRVAKAQQIQANADFDVSIVASQNAGAQRASAFVAQSDKLLRDLGAKAISVRNAQARIGATAEQNTIRTTDNRLTIYPAIITMCTAHGSGWERLGEQWQGYVKQAQQQYKCLHYTGKTTNVCTKVNTKLSNAL